MSSQYNAARKKSSLGYRGVPLLLAVAAFALIPLRTGAQLNSKTASVNLSATLNSSIAITAAPGSVNFALLPNGASTSSSPVIITTHWVLPIAFGTVTEYAYFTSPAAALTDGAGDNIASASVTGSFNGGAFTPFTAISPFAGGSSMTLFNTSFFFIFNNPATRTDSLNLQINTTGLNLPAGHYTGLLHIQAQAL